MVNDHLCIGYEWRIISVRFDQGTTPNQIDSTINYSRTIVCNLLRLFHKINNLIECEDCGRDRALLNNTRRASDKIIVDRTLEYLLRY